MTRLFPTIVHQTRKRMSERMGNATYTYNSLCNPFRVGRRYDSRIVFISSLKINSQHGKPDQINFDNASHFKASKNTVDMAFRKAVHDPSVHSNRLLNFYLGWKNHTNVLLEQPR